MRKLAFVVLLCLSASLVRAQQKTASDSVMITIFLKHQQDKSLPELQAKQKANHFQQLFPPKEARVLSWYVMMGIGQVVTVKIPAAALRTLNLSIENGAWGAFDTEFYPTYDYAPIWREEQRKTGK